MIQSIIGKRLLALFAISTLIAIGTIWSAQTLVGAASTPKTLDRDLEPAVIKGNHLSIFNGVPLETLFVYTYTTTGWGNQIAFQIDEVSADGNYVSIEDGLLDGNDEMVFMAQDLGGQAPETDPLTATLPISSTWYEVQVNDPTNPAKKGWAYVVRSSQLSKTTSNDYVDYNASQQRVTTDQYDLGLATAANPTPFFGVDYLALNSSQVDILDRTKLRVTVSVPLFGTLNFTEENLTNPKTTLIKDGSIRVILRQTANASISGEQGATYKAYGSLFQANSTIDFDGIGISVSKVRTSVDFNSAVSPATFYNANSGSNGTLINGTPDMITELPLSKWTQISHNTGRIVIFEDPSSIGGTQKIFYKDNDAVDSQDTGDQKSYGDSGFLLEGSLNNAFSIQSSFLILPAHTSGADNVGAIYETYFLNPFNIVVREKGELSSVFLPIIIR